MTNQKSAYFNEIRPRESKHILLTWIRIFNWSTLAFVAVGVAALFGHEAHRWCLQAPLFRLKKVSVQGNRLLSETLVLDMSGIQIGCNIFLINVATVKRRLEEHYLVRRADVGRRLPSSLVISIEERNPTALLENDRGTLDDDGVLLPPLPSELRSDLPLLSGIESGSEEYGDTLRSEKVRWAISFIREIAEAQPTAPFEVSEVDVSDFHRPLLYVGSREIPVRIGHDGSLSQLDVLPVVLADVERKGIEPEYIDVRFEGQIIVRPKVNGTVGLES